MESRRNPALPATTTKVTWSQLAAQAEPPRRRPRYWAWTLGLFAFMASAAVIFYGKPSLQANPPQATPAQVVNNIPNTCTRLQSRRSELTTMVQTGVLDPSVYSDIPPALISSPTTDCGMALSVINSTVADEMVRQALYTHTGPNGTWISKTPEQIRAQHASSSQ